MPSQGSPSSPSPSARPTKSERSESEDPSRSHCNCSNGNRPGDYVLCDNDDCKVGWYHWECVNVTKKPLGMWLCPSCSPSPAFYAKQLVQEQEAPSSVSEVEKADEPAASGARQQKRERKRKQEPALGIREKKAAKKGVAVKSPAAPKPKPRWIGWVELSSEREEDFKKKVDAQWSVDNAISGQRRRASKAVGENTENGSRTLRRNLRVGGRKRIVESDADEDEGEPVYQKKDQQQQEEEEEEGAPVHWKDSDIDMLSGDSDNSDYAMDVDAGADDADEDSADELSDPHSDSGKERHNFSDPVRAVSGVEAEDLEDSENMTYQDESLEANRSHSSDVLEYVDANEFMDDNEASETSRTHVNDSHSRRVAVSPVSERAILRENTIDVDAVSDSDEVEVLNYAPTTVESNNSAPLYQRQGNCWGDFPESAIRSTLPRLA